MRAFVVVYATAMIIMSLASILGAVAGIGFWNMLGSIGVLVLALRVRVLM